MTMSVLMRISAPSIEPTPVTSSSTPILIAPPLGFAAAEPLGLAAAADAGAAADAEVAAEAGFAAAAEAGADATGPLLAGAVAPPHAARNSAAALARQVTVWWRRV